MIKKLRFIFAFSIFGVALSAQVCNIDPSLVEPGIYPPGSSQSDSVIVMPNGMVGNFYDEVAQIVVPLDTNVVFGGSTFSATIDSIRILQLVDMPASIGYACNVSNCTWPGGDNGCVRLSGTPVQGDVGLHEVTVQCIGWATVGIFGQVSDTINFYMDITIDNQISIAENALASIDILPNPIKDRGEFRYYSMAINQYSLKIMNLEGKCIQNLVGETGFGSQVIALDFSDLSSGMYFYVFSASNQNITGKFMIE